MITNNPVTGAAQTVVTNHPAGLTAAATTVLVWVASLAGLDIPAEVAVGIVALLTTLVSAFSPRYRTEVREELSSNEPPAGSTGPDRLEDQTFYTE